MRNILKQVPELLSQTNGYSAKHNFVNVFSPGPRSFDTSERSGRVLLFSDEKANMRMGAEEIGRKNLNSEQGTLSTRSKLPAFATTVRDFSMANVYSFSVVPFLRSFPTLSAQCSTLNPLISTPV